MTEYALTLRQPWASLAMAGAMDVLSLGWPVPSTLPQWMKCPLCKARALPPACYMYGDEPACIAHMAPSIMEPDGPFPFRLWIHAGKTVDRVALERPDAVRALLANGYTASDRLPYGALLGSAAVTGCHHADQAGVEIVQFGGWCSPWAEPDAYHWTLADPRPLPEPIPVKGRPRLWRLPDDVAARAREATA